MYVLNKRVIQFTSIRNELDKIQSQKLDQERRIVQFL